MKQTMVCFFTMILATGFGFAAEETVTVPLASALPQLSTILICSAGMVFFGLFSKRVP